MSFENIKKSTELAITAGKTPVIVGERGIGKTAMMREISRDLEMLLVSIDCNLLKEGEIGGLPIPHKNDKGIMVTQYAIHAKLKVIEDYLEQNPDGSVLLFFDEINRTTRETMAELMNLILNRNINGYQIPDSVFIVAAMNPSSTTKGYEGDSSYGVTDMDSASKNRLVWLYLNTDPKEWLSWATDKPVSENTEVEETPELIMFDRSEYETIIDNNIVEFIASNPALLNCPREDLDATPSARTWEFASDIMRTFEKNKKYFDTTHRDACIKGCIGDEAFIQLMSFINNNENPLIKPEEFFAGKEISQELLDKFASDNTARQMIMAKNVARFVGEKKRLLPADSIRTCKIFDCLPIDILIIIMRFIRDSLPKLHDKLLDTDEYLDLYRNANRLAS